ncbi:hypothetical protein D3C76_1710930 [compost metagenome]
MVVETISLRSAMIRPTIYKNISGYKNAIGVPSQRPSWAGNHCTKVNPGFNAFMAVYIPTTPKPRANETRSLIHASFPASPPNPKMMVVPS